MNAQDEAYRLARKSYLRFKRPRWHWANENQTDIRLGLSLEFGRVAGSYPGAVWIGLIVGKIEFPFFYHSQARERQAAEWRRRRRAEKYAAIRSR